MYEFKQEDLTSEQSSKNGFEVSPHHLTKLLIFSGGASKLNTCFITISVLFQNFGNSQRML